MRLILQFFKPIHAHPHHASSGSAAFVHVAVPTRHLFLKLINYNPMKKIWQVALGLILVSSVANAQAPENWFNLDFQKDGVRGVSTERMYAELLKGRPAQTVIVAVIDSGVDVNHEDLKSVMWVNPKEIAGDGLDNDGNGYVDDVHGWNFIGGKDGQNVHHDNTEVARVVALLRGKCAKADPKTLTGTDKTDCERYEVAKAELTSKKNEAQTNLGQYTMLKNMVGSAVTALGKELNGKAPTPENVNAIQSSNQMLGMAVNIVNSLAENGKTFATVDELKTFLVAEVQDGLDTFDAQVKYWYNPDYDPRGTVGDNYPNWRERFYGNNDYQGPDAHHGTHVAGIIGASRTNDLGIKGVADNVRIMTLRAVPDGDERDKDVANAILYAVDHGAKVINMSFGKSHSPYKEAVDAAIRYAESKDVLIIHAAGNDNEDNDATEHFPVEWFGPEGTQNRTARAKNLIEVGALNWADGREALASFSNYGKTEVDVFAPGVDIHSTVPGNGTYKDESGTSMAAPVTAGVAAVLRSYFPKMTALDVKNVLLNSSVKLKDSVLKPGSEDEVVPLAELCVTGGVVNAYEAVKMALNMAKQPVKPIKKPKKPRG